MNIEKWDVANYPFIPDSFKYKLREDSGVKKQLKIIKKIN